MDVISKPKPLHLRIAVGIAVLALLVYAGALANGFTNWDDPMLVTENEQVLTFDIGGIITPTPGQSYQPLRTLSHALDYRLFGDSPAGHHAVNVLLHAVAAAGLYLLLLQLLPRLRSSQSSGRVAAVAALLFAIHPINVEAVAWVASRKYGLLICCTVLAFYCYLRSSRRARVGSAVFTLLAMLASPFGVMLPVVLMATDWAAGEVRNKGGHQLAIGCAMLVGYPLVAIGLFGGSGATGADFELGLLSWPSTMLRVLADYAMLLLAPIDLNASYPNVVAARPGLKALLAFAAIVTAGLWAWRAEDRLPAWLMLWCGLWWLPVSNLVSMSMMMADRYLYLSAIAVFVAAGLGVDRLYTCLPRKQRLITGGVVVCLVLLGLRTAMRVGDWRDSRSLWQASVDCDPRNSGAHTSLAIALLDAGDSEAARHHLEQAVLRSPQNFVAQERLGVLLVKAGENAVARSHLEAALRLNPSAGLYGNLGICTHRLGDVPAAIANFARAVELDPERETFRRNLMLAQLQHGSDLAGQRKYREAMSYLDAVLATDGANVQALRNLAACHYQLGEYDMAAENYRAVLSLAPDDSEAAAWLRKAEATGQ
jgi:Tfp pilus assembly protein PilF